MLLLLTSESQSGRALDGLGVGDALSNSFFLSLNRTTGMATIDMSALREATTVALMVLMFIGGASTSTAGGIKLGAFMVIIAVVVAALRGRRRTEAFGRELPPVIVLRAVTITILGLLAFVVGVWLLALTDSAPFLPLAFEVMSALANVGWSQGLTGGLTTAGAMILVALMFIGRLGALMVVLAIPDRPTERYRYPTGAVRIG